MNEIARLQKLAGLLLESDNQELEEISFSKGHASSASQKRISARMLNSDNLYGSKEFWNQMKALGATESIGNDFDLDTQMNDQIENAIKATANEVITGPEFELLVYDNISDDIRTALVNPLAATLGTYFLGIINLELEEPYKGQYNASQAVDMPIYQIHWSNIGDELKGMGIGKQLYTLVYEWVKSKGAALASDTTLFEGSAGMWTKYMPQIASYFGVILGDAMIIPVSKEEALLDKFKYFRSADGFIAFEKPSKTLRTILYNLKGLSFSKGEIYVVDLFNYSINDNILDYESEKSKPQKATIFDLVDESPNMKSLLNKIGENTGDVGSESGGKIGAKTLNRSTRISTVKAAIFLFKNTVLVVKTVSTGEEEVLPKGKRRDKDGKLIKLKKLTRLVAVTI